MNTVTVSNKFNPTNPNEGTIMTTHHTDEDPSTPIEFTLRQLRQLSKSVSRTRDSELKKLERLKAGWQRDECRTDVLTLDSIDVEIQGAISDLVTNL